MVLVHGNIIPTKHVGERTDSLRSKNWILILKKIDLLLECESVEAGYHEQCRPRHRS